LFGGECGTGLWDFQGGRGGLARDVGKRAEVSGNTDGAMDGSGAVTFFALVGYARTSIGEEITNIELVGRITYFGDGSVAPYNVTL
jgi:hypothetical protein